MLNKTKYTAFDFQRYHAGDMPEAEMYALEKAALSDPFLADALEGYAHTEQAEQDLVELRARMSGEKKKEKVFWLQPVAGWWRVAALLITVLGGALLLYTLNDNSSQNTLAKIESAAPQTTSDVLRRDSSASAAPESITAETSVASDAATSSAKDSDRKAATQKVIPVEEPVTVATMSAKKPAANVENGLQGNVPGTNVQSVTMAPAPPSMADSMVLASENMARAKSAKRDDRPEGYYSNSETNVGRKDQNALEATARLGKNTGVDSFQRFAQSNRRAVFDGSQNIAQGEVALVFDTDKKGIPKNIEVNRSTCNVCEEEAKRLLRSGPRWRPSNRRDSVVIRF